MEYARFVRLRRGVWEEFEAGLEAARQRSARLDHREVEELALGYRRVLHDHALAAARYPGTGAARKLRRLALEGTRWLHLGAAKRPGLGHFFFRAFPRSFHAHLPLLGLTAVLFAGAALFGLLLAAVRPGAGVAFLGEEAIAGLAEGRLWTESLVTTVPPSAASSGIATNNLSVALTAWAGGAAAGLFGFYIVLLNGFFLGAVVGVTLHYSMAGELFEFVAAHGPLEITLILVAAAAGLGVGRALVASGDRPRGEAVSQAARLSLTLLAGCLPWFVLLGLVEAFVSPSPEVSPGLKLALGLALWLAFLALALNPMAEASSADHPEEMPHG